MPASREQLARDRAPEPQQPSAEDQRQEQLEEGIAEAEAEAHRDDQ